MLQDERINDEQTALRAVLRAWQLTVWTALPGILQSFDGNTATVQPSVQGKIRSPDGTVANKSLPLLIYCPVLFPSGGGFSVTTPLTSGNEGLVVFASRCIDGWWQTGQVSPQIELRMHHLSDGFFIPGCRSKPNFLGSVSTNSLQVRSDDGECYLEIAAGHIVNVVAPGGINVTGDLHVTGAVIAGFGGADQVGLQTHTHPGNGDPPTPGT